VRRGDRCEGEQGELSKGRGGAVDEGTGSDFVYRGKKIKWFPAAEIIGISDRQTASSRAIAFEAELRDAFLPHKK